MSVRTAAKDAWRASQVTREGAAREALGVALAPFDVGVLEVVHSVAHSDTAGGLGLFVFSDGDVFLSCGSRGQGWEVHVVREDAGWTRIGGPVESLAHLGQILPPAEESEEPPAEPAAPKQWVAGSSYDLGAEVAWDDRVWVSLVAGNHWGPPGSTGLSTVWQVKP